MFGLIDRPMTLWYVLEDNRVINAGAFQPEEHWYAEWLDSMVNAVEDTNFFLTTDTTDTTDVFVKEWDFNTVVHRGDDEVIRHSYSDDCPEGCYGQMDECVYRREFEEAGGIVVDGLHVPFIGLFGIRNFKWGNNPKRSE